MNSLTFKPFAFDTGVDWLTITAKTTDNRENLYGGCLNIMRSEIDIYGRPKPWRWKGYIGRAQRYLNFGERGDSAIAQFMSERANDHWRDAASAAENCTRLDLCLDLYFNHDVDMAEYHWRQCEARDDLWASRNYTRIITNRGKGTMYVGARSSQVFGRIYDKKAQLGVAEPKSIWRYEVECKSPLAMEWLSELLKRDEMDSQMVIAWWIADWFASRGCALPLKLHLERAPQGERPERPDVDTRLRWLDRVVSPTVNELLAYGLGAEVRDVLGLEKLIVSRETLKGA